MNVLSTNSISLDTLTPGTIAVVATLSSGSNEEMVDRLREIGFAEGLTIELLHESPFGKDPIAVRVGDMTVALRRAQARLIKVKIV